VANTIRWDRRSVAVVIRTHAHFSMSSFAAAVNETPARIRRMASGRLLPTPAVVRHFGLTVDGKDYLCKLK
jgi:hypothetical protein